MLGCYYMTSERELRGRPGQRDACREDGARSSPRWKKSSSPTTAGVVDLQARIMVRTDRDGGEIKRIETTVGRAIFNLALPPTIGKYYNETMGRKQLRKVVADCYRYFKDPYDTARIVNEIKKVGFEFSTRGGMSIAVDDVVMSEQKAGLLGEGGRSGPSKIERQYRRGLVTEDERLRELEADLEQDPRRAVEATSKSACGVRTRST